MSMGQYWCGSRDQCERKDFKTNKQTYKHSVQFHLQPGSEAEWKWACCGGRIESSGLRGGRKTAEGIGWKDLFLPTTLWKEHLSRSKFHRTTSECWQRTSGTQKGSPLSLKGGRTKYKSLKRETKEVGTEIWSGKGVLKEEKFPNTRKHSHWQISGEF